MWKVSFILWSGSVGLLICSAYELGLFSFTPSLAAEGKTVASAAPSPGVSRSPAASPSVEKDKNECSIPGMESLERSIQDREKVITAQEVDLARQKRDLRQKEEELSSRTAHYEQVIQELEKKVGKLTETNDEKVDSFRALYEKMETKKVAAVLDQLDTSLAWQILGKMRQAKAAEVMSAMSNEKVRLLTEKFLQKHLTASSHAASGQ